VFPLLWVPFMRAVWISWLCWFVPAHWIWAALRVSFLFSLHVTVGYAYPYIRLYYTLCSWDIPRHDDHHRNTCNRVVSSLQYSMSPEYFFSKKIALPDGVTFTTHHVSLFLLTINLVSSIGSTSSSAWSAWLSRGGSWLQTVFKFCGLHLIFSLCGGPIFKYNYGLNPLTFLNPSIVLSH